MKSASNSYWVAVLFPMQHEQKITTDLLGIMSFLSGLEMLYKVVP
jgi:hypothetical protein